MYSAARRQVQVLLERINPFEIRGIGVSDKPRNTEGSYMPCFRAGSSMGKAFAEVLKIPYCEFSHQEGHITAVVPGNIQELSKIRSAHLFVDKNFP